MSYPQQQQQSPRNIDHMPPAPPTRASQAAPSPLLQPEICGGTWSCDGIFGSCRDMIHSTHPCTLLDGICCIYYHLLCLIQFILFCEVKPNFIFFEISPIFLM